MISRRMVLILFAMLLDGDLQAQTPPIALLLQNSPLKTVDEYCQPSAAMTTVPVNTPVTFAVCASLVGATDPKLNVFLSKIRIDIDGRTSLIMDTRAMYSNGINAVFPIGPVTFTEGPHVIDIFVADSYSYTKPDGTVVVDEVRWSNPLHALVNQGTIPVPPPPCSLTLGQPSTALTAAGGTGTVALTATDISCEWFSSTSDPLWLNVTPITGKGSTSLTYAGTPNFSTSQRSALIRAGTATVTVTQVGIPTPPTACTYTLENVEQAQQFPRSGGTRIFNIVTPGACPWTVSDNAGWISAYPSSGAGSLSIRLSAGRHNGRGVRTAHISVAGYTFQVQQAGR